MDWEEENLSTFIIIGEQIYEINSSLHIREIPSLPSLKITYAFMEEDTLAKANRRNEGRLGSVSVVGC